MTDVQLFTDGACRGNPGPGGWAALLRLGDKERMLSGACRETTNNQMEMQAAIEGLQALSRPCTVHLSTDSQYLLKGMTQWMSNWKRRGWKTASNAPVKNVELWKRLDALAQTHTIDWHWVKGHSGHPENERVDQAANEAIDAMQAGDR